MDNFHPAWEAKRLESFDLTRGLAVLFMVCQHAVFMFGATNVQTSLLGYLLIVLGRLPAAPVFLLLMGIFFVYNDRTKEELFRLGLSKGIKLFLLGYFLNIIRFSLPIIFGVPLLTFSIHHGQLILLSTSIFIVGILQCAGMSLIVLAFFTRYFYHRGLILGTIIAILFTFHRLSELSSELALNLVFNLIWTQSPTILFPVIPNIIYPFVGLHIGNKMKNIMKKQSLSAILSPYRNIGLILYPLALIIKYRYLLPEWLFRLDTVLAAINKIIYIRGVMTIGFLFIWIWIGYTIIQIQIQIQHFPTILANDLIQKSIRIVLSAVYYLSKNITVFYIVHWSVISFLTIIIGYRSHNIIVTLTIIPLIIISSWLLIELFRTLNRIVCLKLRN